MSDPLGYDGGAGTAEYWENERYKEKVRKEAIPYREAALLKATKAYQKFEEELKAINKEYEDSVHYYVFRRITKEELK